MFFKLLHFRPCRRVAQMRFPRRKNGKTKLAHGNSFTFENMDINEVHMIAACEFDLNKHVVNMLDTQVCLTMVAASYSRVARLRDPMTPVIQTKSTCIGSRCRNITFWNNHRRQPRPLSSPRSALHNPGLDRQHRRESLSTTIFTQIRS